MNTEEILAYDREHVWHPYASMRNPIKVWQVESARGAMLSLAGGEEVIDGMSSWWAVAHGYNNEHINEALKRQIAKMSHVMFGGLTHEGAVLLAKRLIEISPRRMQKIFFSDSGSVSVEVAMKMALQYWHSKGVKNKTKFATARGGYHGDTWNAMSVCDPVGGMHSIFSGRLPINFFAPKPNPAFGEPWNEDSIGGMREILRDNRNEIAAVIIEPIVQGAGGMRFYHPQYLKELRALCDELGILLILDEIATGFYRSGRLFACEYAGVEPDIMCVGKALTGGYMSFAATLASDDVADTISNGGVGLFMHGPTFMANPLACAAANASLDLVLQPQTPLNVLRIEKKLKDGLAAARDIKGVADARALGAIGVLEMEKPIDMAKAQELLIERGVWLRPFGRLLYTMPPYISTDSQLERITSAMVEVAGLI
ncbi:adenosylmethionine-8-amino-7-oxononanoate aminotransferase [Coraliomargarita sp. CAG:312]|nr:adenosylmethionine-8-amino-7-oxononanoate aminotransferase [Coraliomargarita sp. CAG:312]